MDNESKKLNRRLIHETFQSKEYRNDVKKFIKELSQESMTAPNEKTIETRFDQALTVIFNKYLNKFGYVYRPIKEEAINTSRSVTKGHADTSVGNVIIEFKQPKTLSNEKQRKEALNQAISYIQGANRENTIKTYGVVTDGRFIAIYRYEHKNFVKGQYHEMKFIDFHNIVKAIMGLEYKTLSSQNLVADFAQSNNSPAKHLAQSLFLTLSQSRTTKTKMLISEWMNLFKLSHSDKSKQLDIQKRKQALEKFFETDLSNAKDEYNALFALQSSYTILLKLLSFKVISQIKFDPSLKCFSSLLTASDELLQIEMKDIEDGSIMRDYGISNLLEGDYFSWYSTKEQWNTKIAHSIKEMLSLLDSYSSNQELNKIDEAQDFFKVLYQSMIPAEVRHSLGEYYTPHWLAQNIINESLKEITSQNWRAIDPSCGSGTFLTVLINEFIKRHEKMDKSELVSRITRSIVGIDINPLAVLTARVNYFLNISSLLTDDIELEIPVYSGDSAYTPQLSKKDGICFVNYSLETNLAPFNVSFPLSGIKNLKKFSKTMNEIELDIQSKNIDSVYKRLLQLVDYSEQQNITVKNTIYDLASKFVEFEEKNWNGIWARIIANYLTTSQLGKFDLIVGNLPWIDWKSLPSLYRNKIKALPISKTIFSGDYQTGGINLNIAALITNVVITNWLDEKGIFAMLMPDTFLVQKTYEGFRKLILGNGKLAYFQKIDDWRKAKDPFYPVTQKFFTYFIGFKKVDYRNSGVPVKEFCAKKGTSTRSENLDIDSTFTISTGKYYQLSSDSNHFTLQNKVLSNEDIYALIGQKKSTYKGREGIEFYPQELFLFKLVNQTKKNQSRLENLQFKKSKYKIPVNSFIVENKFIRPLIKGTDITSFHAKSSAFTIFPYDPQYSERVALSELELSQRAPLTYKYLKKYEDIFNEQNTYSKKMINGKNIPFYSLARVGKYTFGKYNVVFRDNTKNVAAVVSTISTPLGRLKPVFQNHAVTISQRPDGTFISEDEAYYIAGVMNSEVVNEYIKASSDSRSFPINPRYQIPLYGLNAKIMKIQKDISKLSKKAHQYYDDQVKINILKKSISEKYLKLLQNLI
ncbi:Eco57I restriction-modification methylase domain-containing protein [Limosilactobacillus reuteri]|uniref:Eco57I restriction-modification methylase domain-containing protein n=1 Tax=Limosilactobacillus reuteri TaxID=1598 RepID=UPI00081C140A|nr:SAM-dependent DNA methyltransferase [Limosilactobacillus reuteri]OCW62347.1 hypothetical protein BBP10_08445 [Limosilactobacillus reuteri]OCW65941.1 hypothetical protein BBP12_03340 [Limosilactobacillus reuteri]OCW66018.1 hypothetical protein BBP11_04230 [Limosilactobacillus reuteri]OCW67175.1 hypothetical protein BBP13_09705 [Limosilactobacillus reuteri]